MSDYPVGAQWKAVAKDGTTGLVTLRRRDWRFEFWEWSCVYEDGSHPRRWFDWGPSRRVATESAKDCLAGMISERPLPRFKRIDNEE